MFVANITSDMGSSISAMWNAFSIRVSKLTNQKYSVPHPEKPNRKLYFMADVPYVIKNLRAALCKGNFKFKDQTISAQPILSLAEYDAARDFKLAPKLKASHVNASHFDQMKVSGAMHVFSNSVSSGLRFMLDNNLIEPRLQKETESTA